MTDGRKRIAGALATLCITALSGSFLTTGTSHADPSIEDVRTRVDRLYEEAEHASERYNDARVRLGEAQTRLQALQVDLNRQQRKVDAIRKQVAGAVVAQYQGQALTTTSQVVLSEDPDAFLSQLATVAEYNDQQGAVLADFDTQAKQLQMRQEATERELAGIEKTRKVLAAEKATIEKKAAEAEAVLDELEADARERLLAASRSGVRVPLSDIPASGRATAVLRYAMAQVGDAYAWGATGPNAFDCSGFTMMAWAQAGVGLPHSSSAQQGSGARVSASALRPGDLVFYYSPVSHVGIYIGNGMIVHAARPGEGVKVSPLYSMPFSGAVRPG